MAEHTFNRKQHGHIYIPNMAYARHSIQETQQEKSNSLVHEFTKVLCTMYYLLNVNLQSQSHTPRLKCLS